MVFGDCGDDGTGDETSTAKCSFDPSTPVLLADGAQKPIGKIKVGDEVESADPTTGKDSGGRTVQYVWINHDNDLLDVTVNTGTGHTSTLHTTANHPFWDATTHTWVRADHLKSGYKLASTNGQHPTVAAVKTTPGAANRYNLTIQQLHTYYVIVGGTPILVHNSNCNSNILSNAAGFDNSHELAGASAGDVYSGVFDPESGTFYARLSLAQKDPANFPNAVLESGGHGEVNFWHFNGSRKTVGFNIFMEGDGASVAWFSRSVNRRNFGDPMAPVGARQDILDAITNVTGTSVRSR
jgi:hypothetical protein